jgi:hypothetical protein
MWRRCNSLIPKEAERATCDAELQGINHPADPCNAINPQKTMVSVRCDDIAG